MEVRVVMGISCDERVSLAEGSSLLALDPHGV
jgi:hypothetical protein